MCFGAPMFAWWEPGDCFLCYQLFLALCICALWQGCAIARRVPCDHYTFVLFGTFFNKKWNKIYKCIFQHWFQEVCRIQSCTDSMPRAMLFFSSEISVRSTRKYLFPLPKNIISGSKYSKNILFNFDYRSTGHKVRKGKELSTKPSNIA